ncbi:hypothetical protein [Pseudomonas mangiferae]|uniref:Uncharacterized protein n=1 Tax=Pseudomonas mangiferae TaxID=2593654 RepID=A0A553GZ37_9PSED|nr:hypothetical protein [Pseudomonas mangiferae]TRX74770.1 hypothetical protein FM069_09520 [Pseudomonas mangiferae]
MGDFNRIDVVEGKRLEREFELDSISYTDLQMIHYEFVKKIVFDEALLSEKKISKPLILYAIKANEKILHNISGDLSELEFRAEKINIWKFQESLKGEEKKFLKIILNGFSGKEDFEEAINNDSATVSMFLSGEFFDSLALGGSEFCKKHAEFVRQHRLLKPYKIFF